MKKEAKIKIASLGLALGIAAGVIVPASISYATDDDIGYTFTIQGWQQNTSGTARYRETSDTTNAWKVRVTNSTESGGDTYTRFWLQNRDSGSNVSASMNVMEDKGYYYNNPYSSANKSWVRLTAENNNYNNDVFDVTGHWDEEIR
jgi:Protein of unknown function (DUF2712)